MIVRCDGCHHEIRSEDLYFAQADGRECRYCIECHEHFQAFTNACAAKEQELNRVLDLFILQTRARVPLKLCPQDLPRAEGLG